MTEDERIGDGFFLTFAEMQIRVADTTCFHLHQQFTRSWNRHLYISDE
jgi:hypothetical protein